MIDDRLLVRIPVILMALTIHELAHAWSALRLGDSTAKNEGRITLNPLPHLDLLGTLMIMFGPFGWAKPVPVNPYNLRKPKRDLMIVSFAGPLSNIILAICFGGAIRILTILRPDFILGADGKYVLLGLVLGVIINTGLAFFNMLPFYPLDGSKVVAGFLPDRHVESYMAATRHALPVIFGILILGYFTNKPILSMILNPIFTPFLQLIQLIALGGVNALGPYIGVLRMHGIAF